MTKNMDCATTLEQQPQQLEAAADAPVAIRVKREKIDKEIEAKLKTLNDKLKTPPTASGTESDASNSQESLQDDKKQITPVKSSNEILAELFGVFNAAPPVELLDDNNLLKKHKKTKKERNKRSRDKANKSDGECSDSNGETAEDKSKHKHKRKKHKHKHKHKDGKDKHKDKDREKSKEKTNSHTKLDETTETRKRHASTGRDSAFAPAKKETTQLVNSTERDKDRAREREQERDRDRAREREREKEHERDKARDRDRERDRERERERERERDRERGHDRERERIHNSFYNSCPEKHDDKYQSKARDDRRLSDDLSLSDEETYLREKANGHRRFYGDDKPEHTNSNAPNENMGSRRRRKRLRKRSRSRSRDLGIDKKRLLEIARKNAISMFKRGDMPGVETMAPEDKDRVLVKMRYTGRTVQDLTEFCKKLSNGEKLSDLSSDEESDVDKNGNAKAFHHPFQLKEREPIKMHIRNSAPTAPPSMMRDEQTKALTKQFPVSSGEDHRLSEVWVPVNPKPALAPLPNLPPAKQATNMFKDVQRNVFAKSIPQQEQQEPAFKPSVNSTDSGVTDCTGIQRAANSLLPTPLANTPPVAIPAPPAPVQPQPLLPPPFVPEVPIPSAAPPALTASVLPQSQVSSTEVSNLVTQRLNAIRRLQDNPADSEAMRMMYNAQNSIPSGTSSKFLPGQFTGSTGAQVMKVHELNSGRQLWTRPDQLTSTKPVTGGMGMTLLQKMGWKPGEGLGRCKSGSLQPLQLTVKLDKRGLVSREDIKQQPARTKNSNLPKNSSAVNIAQAALTAPMKHPVCVLNELTSKNRWTPPQYTLKEDSGPSHSRMFLFSVEINGQVYTPSEACNNKKEAKLNAAKLCLRSLGILPPS